MLNSCWTTHLMNKGKIITQDLDFFHKTSHLVPYSILIKKLGHDKVNAFILNLLKINW